MRNVYEQKNFKQIARLMDVSPHTVDERVRKVLKKLNVANRIEAAQFLADNGAFDYAIPQPPLRYQLANLANATPTAEGHHNGARGIFDIGAPFPTATQPVNSHRGMTRIIWPILIAFATVLDRTSARQNSSHQCAYCMPSSAA